MSFPNLESMPPIDSLKLLRTADGWELAAFAGDQIQLQLHADAGDPERLAEILDAASKVLVAAEGGQLPQPRRRNFDERENEDLAAEQFPQLMNAVDAADKLLKKIRSLRNKGRASERDVEQAREARRQLLTILDHGNWAIDSNPKHQ